MEGQASQSQARAAGHGGVALVVVLPDINVPPMISADSSIEKGSVPGFRRFPSPGFPVSLKFLCNGPNQWGESWGQTPLKEFTISTKLALQSAGCRRSTLWARCSAALNQDQTAAIGPTRENRLD
jgi:hypothetical protein